MIVNEMTLEEVRHFQELLQDRKTRLHQQQILAAGGFVCRSCGSVCSDQVNDGRDLCTTCQWFYDTLAMQEWAAYELPDLIRSAEVTLTVGKRRDDYGLEVDERGIYLDDLRIRIGNRVFQVQAVTEDGDPELYAEVV